MSDKWWESKPVSRVTEPPAPVAKVCERFPRKLKKKIKSQIIALNSRGRKVKVSFNRSLGWIVTR